MSSQDALHHAAAPVWVEDQGDLEARCRAWSGAKALAVDTEFVRERTFYPGLGLIQISDRRENVLIDPIALMDLSALEDLLTDRRIVKVFHSCSEDLEALHHRFGKLPLGVFDTQIAAAFSGLGFSRGLGSLIAELFGHEIPKAETRTNWLRRPLRPEQLEYAALDVAYLLPIHDRLLERLAQLGRVSWLQEELLELEDSRRFESDPEEAFQRLRRTRGLDRRRLAVLRELAVWREREARRRDLPRNFVLRDAALPELARKPPKSLRALANVSVLREDERRRHGRTIIALIRDALALPEDELPERPRPPIDLSPYKKDVERMRRAVGDVAQELELPAELLATRRTIERVARRALGGRDPVLPRVLRGWRYPVVGERLLKIAESLVDGRGRAAPESGEL